MAWVEIAWPPGQPPQRREVGRGLIFGRSEEAEVVLGDPSVSAKHAWIREVGGRYVLIDLRSTNGVTLNGTRVEEAVLHDGDTFTLADVVCRFHDPLEAHATGRTPGTTTQARPHEPARKEPVFYCPACGHVMPTSLTACPRCGYPSAPSGAAPGRREESEEERLRRQVRAMSSLAFAGGLVGPILLGVGWILGIVLGIMVLTGYRWDGDETDVRLARRGLLLGLLWLTLLLWGALFFSGRLSLRT